MGIMQQPPQGAAQHLSSTSDTPPHRAAVCETALPCVARKLAINSHISEKNHFYIAVALDVPYNFQTLQLYEFDALSGRFTVTSNLHIPILPTTIKWSPHERLAAEQCFFTTSDRFRVYRNGRQVDAMEHTQQQQIQNRYGVQRQSIDEYEDAGSFRGNDYACVITSGDWSSFDESKVVTCGLDGRAVLWSIDTQNLQSRVSGYQEILRVHVDPLIRPAKRRFPIVSNDDSKSLASINGKTSEVSKEYSLAFNVDDGGRATTHRKSPISPQGPSETGGLRMPIVDVAFGTGSNTNIVAVALGNKDVHLLDTREPPEMLLVDGNADILLSQLSWSQQSSHGCLMQSDLENDSILFYDLRYLTRPLQASSTLFSNKRNKKSLLSSVWNPVKPHTVLAAFDEGLIEVWDVPECMDHPPTADVSSLKSQYCVNECFTDVRRSITAFDAAPTAYTGENRRSVQLAAIALCPVVEPQIPHVDSYPLGEKMRLMRSHQMNLPLVHPTLQLVRID